MGGPPHSQRATVRLDWLDVIKGVSILWIVFFHCFGTYNADRFPSPTEPHYLQSFLSQCEADTALRMVLCGAGAVFVAVTRLGFHAVGVFLVLSGFGLAYALGDTAPAGGWRRWYWRRALRLFPMYWLAHVIYLVSPFVARPEPIDYRFLLSFLGDRVWPVYSIFYYANPAWWYFGLLLQLYLVFPLLFALLRRSGLATFLALCGVGTIAIRSLLLFVVPVHGYYVQGAFFGSRLWEFAAGMALGAAWRRDPVRQEQRLFAPATLLSAIFIYALGLYSYRSMLTYTGTDLLVTTGLFVILAHLSRWLVTWPRAGAVLTTVGAYSYGLYLLHQPYVTYVGERLRGLTPAAFVPIALMLTVLLAVAAMPLERWVNQLVDRTQKR